MIHLWSEYHDPVRELDQLRREFDALLGRGWAGRATTRRAASWPRVSIFDEGASLVLRAEIPGVDDDDLGIEANVQTLTIRGKRTIERPEGYSAHRRERADVEFARSFQLPCKVDLEKVTAALNDGVLNVRLPKAPEEQPRNISVKVS